MHRNESTIGVNRDPLARSAWLETLPPCDADLEFPDVDASAHEPTEADRRWLLEQSLEDDRVRLGIMPPDLAAAVVNGSLIGHID